jgi:hypothetical protein
VGERDAIKQGKVEGEGQKERKTKRRREGTKRDG